MSPFLTKMRKKKAEVIRMNINLEQFKDALVSHLYAMRMINERVDIIDIEFGQPSKGCVPLEIYVKKEDVEDQVDKKKSGKKRP